ncbi:hypothetical protein CR203_11715 [Salipaludibacillus neizhouensis]|uniref:DUF624 domain-containing protein n=1 Tax=Salipaludibacillus neizhouensis TaxID=885475 RepID=A0A3A9K8L6_9BACI|nr:YesL family protein [Salipaludibacillus neizhouensis]RKL67170.1 hypothetical protein CR203_11715 [Salipaludibacillus neizhouensis]
MEMGRLFTSIYNLCQWICYFFYLNVMWVFCTLLGGIIFGIAPSTTAVFAVARKTALGEEDVKVFRAFWEAYKKEFFRANILGICLTAFGLLWYFNLNFFRSFEGSLYFSLNVLMTIIGVVFLLMLLYIFPVFVHFDLKLYQYVKFSIAFSFLFFGNVLVMLITCISTYYFLISFPGFIPIFGVSLLVQLNMWMACQSFKKVERKRIFFIRGLV